LDSEDIKDKDDEKPTIVTLKPGDLTAEEVERLGGVKGIFFETISWWNCVNLINHSNLFYFQTRRMTTRRPQGQTGK